MKDKNLYKRLLILAVPLALQNIITYAVGVADNVMVGSLGELAISGVYLCNQIQIILQMFVTGIGAAQIVLGTQYWGKQDKESMKSIVGIAIKFSCFCAIIFGLLVFLFPNQVLNLYSNEAEVIAEAMKYLKIICFTYLFFTISNVLMSSLRCIGDVTISLITAIVTFVINIFFNWVLIFGKLGMPAMGVEGAAIATLISRIVEFIIIVVYFLLVDKKLQYKISDLLKNNVMLWKDFFRYGFPVILGDLQWGINLAVQGAIVGRLGPASIAAVSIANTIFSIISVGVYGTASASSIIIGNTVGEGDMDKIKKYSKQLQVVFIIVGICTSILLFSIKDHLLLMYDISDESRKIARSLMIVLSITIIGTSYQMSTLTGIVRAGGSTHFVLLNDLFFVWGIVIPLSLFMAFVAGAPTWLVFLCLKSDQILKCIVAVIKVNRYDWIKKLTTEAVT